jgi:serine/threonine-protein kinase
MSPERVRGEDVDGRTDIFSLGAMLYEMLTGVAPFTATDLPTILDQILHAMPEPPTRRNRDIPPAFDAIVARALAKDREDRFPDAQQMADALRRFAEPVRDEAPVARHAAPVGERPALLVGAAAKPAPHAGPPAVAATPMFVAPRPEPLPAATSSASAPRWRRPALIAVPLVAVAALALWLATPSRAPKPPASTTPIASSAPAATPAPAPVTDDAPASVAAAPAATVPPPAAPRATPAQPPAPTPPSPPPSASAQLGLAVSPWGEVYVNGRKAGVSPPLTELRLPPGKYAVEIRNATFPPFRTSVELRAQESVKLRHKFQ